MDEKDYMANLYLSGNERQAIKELWFDDEYVISKKIGVTNVELKIQLVEDNLYRVSDITKSRRVPTSKDLNAPAVFHYIEFALSSYIYKKGTGRPPLGITKKVSITLLEESWTEIDKNIAAGKYKSLSDYFRQLHLNSIPVNKSIKADEDAEEIILEED